MLKVFFQSDLLIKIFGIKINSAKFERILKSMKDYSSRQTKKPIFREDTGIVCASRAYLWRQGRRIGDNIKIIINNNPIDIDIHDDYDMFLVRKTFEYCKKIIEIILPQIH